MSNELDEILVEMLRTTKKSLRKTKTLLRLMPDDIQLQKGVKIIENKIMFFENMIENKQLIKKKRKRKKDYNQDILERNKIYKWYRDIFFVSTIGYKIMFGNTLNYLSLFTKKDKK